MRARSAADHNHRYLFGWVPTKQGDTDLGAWQWGGTLVVHEVYQRLDRSLGVRIPGTEPRSLSAADGQASIVVADLPADQLFLVTLQLTAHARSFAIRLFENDLGTAYAFTVRGGE